MALPSGSSKIAIVNLAFSYLGKSEAIHTLNEDPMVSRVSNMYDSLVQALLISHAWGFTIKTEQLAEVNSAPINTGWSHQYQWPATALGVRRVYLQGNIVGYFEYKIQGDKILTNLTGDIMCDFIRDPGPEFYPAYFVTLMSYYLAWSAAILVTQKADVEAQQKAKYDFYRPVARNLDYQQYPQEEIQRNDVYWSHFTSWI